METDVEAAEKEIRLSYELSEIDPDPEARRKFRAMGDIMSEAQGRPRDAVVVS